MLSQHLHDCCDRAFGGPEISKALVDRPEPNALFFPLFWPLVAVATAGRVAAGFLEVMAKTVKGREDAYYTPEWTTPNTVRLDLPSMRLRDFSLDTAEPATLICAPFALHRSTVADFSSGHSLVETLLGAGLHHLLITDWRSATADMRNFSIDTYLADLNIAVDELEPPVNLVGLCQGGWLALLYAARFPGKVSRLVLVGAPVDVAAAPSWLVRLVVGAPFAWFENLVRAGDGRVSGQQLLETWSPPLAAADIEEILQTEKTDLRRNSELECQFRRWWRATVDLPGTYYLQVVLFLFKENRIAANRFVALGNAIDLRHVTVPICLLAGDDDEIVSPKQLLATQLLVGTRLEDIVTIIEPCRHLSLFIGKKTLATAWPRIARWLTPNSGASCAVC